MPFQTVPFSAQAVPFRTPNQANNEPSALGARLDYRKSQPMLVINLEVIDDPMNTRHMLATYDTLLPFVEGTDIAGQRGRTVVKLHIHFGKTQPATLQKQVHNPIFNVLGERIRRSGWYRRRTHTLLSANLSEARPLVLRRT